jgi:hypothetical protein
MIKVSTSAESAVSTVSIVGPSRINGSRGEQAILAGVGESRSQIGRVLRAEASDIEQKETSEEAWQAELRLEAAATQRAKYEQAMAEKHTRT